MASIRLVLLDFSTKLPARACSLTAVADGRSEGKADWSVENAKASTTPRSSFTPMEDDYVAEQVPEFGLRFLRPGWWQFRLEEEEPATYLYWDEYTGSLRITVWREARPSFSAADFLVDVLDREHQRGHAPEWRLIQGRRFVCWQQDNAKTGTRSHFYITAHEDRIVTCSFAYHLSLLDDELSALELEGAMEDADRVLESLTLS
jgi:hypothetical protein